MKRVQETLLSVGLLYAAAWTGRALGQTEAVRQAVKTIPEGKLAELFRDNQADPQVVAALRGVIV